VSTTTRRPTRKPVRATRKQTPVRRKPAGAARQAARPPRRGLGEVVRGILGGQTDDVVGMALLVVAVLAALGIYSDLAGPAGHALETGSGDLLGWARTLLPPALALVGGSLVRARVRKEPARLTFGCILVVVAVAGLIEEISGPVTWPSKVHALSGAGGLVGFGVGAPLRDGVGVWGAGLVLLAVVLIALLVLTATPVRQAGDRAALAIRAATRTGLAFGRWLGRLGQQGEREAAADRHPATTSPFDQDASAPAAGRRRPPRPAANDDGEDDGEVDDTATTASVSAVPHAERPPVHITLPPPPEPVDPDALEVARPNAPDGEWRLPPLALLKRTEAAEIDRRLIEAKGRSLEDALAAHGVETRLVGMTVGPTVTRYELELGPGVKVAKVTNLQKDIAYAMAAADVRILAPIPGRSAIGVEVPNAQRQLVAVGDILTSPEARDAVHPLEVAMGRDIAGRAVMANLAQMPHILVAGATGAGKSSCINSILTSLLVRATPDQVRLILVDPKRVELGQYNGLPHLLTQVVTNPKKAANALAWAVHEMERRYDLLAEVGVRDITGYNEAFDRGDLHVEPELGAEAREYVRLPFILVVIDELNDLMMVAARDVEESIVRIAQMARAVGIHLVIATQRPSVDVITGVIKANVPSRLAFAVSSLADSRVILDQPGAERLIGKGDMLLLTASSSVARRVQGAWVDEDEVRKVVAHWRRQSEPRYVEGVEGGDSGSGAGGSGPASDDDDDDDLMARAMELIVRSQLGSTSMLQRKLRVGFARAGRIMDLLEERGVVGPAEGSKARTVLMSVEELEGRAEG
jgi:S-DNA-T family DNA segregation ATPase FtsK/SpoIIIE